MDLWLRAEPLWGSVGGKGLGSWFLSNLKIEDAGFEWCGLFETAQDQGSLDGVPIEENEWKVRS